MERTTKQIADMLGVDKQKVYRYIKKNHINEVHQKNGVKHFSEAVQKQIKWAFEADDVHQNCFSEALHEAHHDAANDMLVELLKRQLEVKDKQIEEMQRLLDQEQQLRMAAEHQKVLKLEQPEEEKIGFLKKLLKKGE